MLIIAYNILKQHSLPVFIEVFIFLSRPDSSNSRVDFSTDKSSRPERIVTIRRNICSFPELFDFLFKLHDPTSGGSVVNGNWRSD